MASMKITFDGFKDLATELDRMGGNLKAATNEALEATFDIVQNNLKSAASKYAAPNPKTGRTGKMYKAIKVDKDVEWTGDVAKIGVGFDLNAPGGVHSIFVMYGTPKHRVNHPGIKKDTKVYNAIRGSNTQSEIASKQEEVLKKYLSMGGKK